jgi:hypothetical protein
MKYVHRQSTMLTNGSFAMFMVPKHRKKYITNRSQRKGVWRSWYWYIGDYKLSWAEGGDGYFEIGVLRHLPHPLPPLSLRHTYHLPIANKCVPPSSLFPHRCSGCRRQHSPGTKQSHIKWLKGPFDDEARFPFAEVWLLILQNFL